jgi:Rrf2 family nitric oxide-sensitive transcriptional repressor
MRLSLFSDYSVRTLMYGALADDRFQLDDVTTAYGISRHHLGKVVHQLGRLGYLDTRRGRGGGIGLARPIDDIRLGKLIRETENHNVLVECFDPATNTCPLNGHCRLKSVLAEALGAFYASLDRYTLRDLVSGPHRARMSRTLLGDATTGAPARG